VAKMGLSDTFRNNYLLPVCGAIWSTPVEDVDQFPAKSLVQFFRNHGLLAGTGAHQWWTVKGGSIEYVRRLEAALILRGCTIRAGAAVRQVLRGDLGVEIAAGDTALESFDEVIFACHSDQALAILGVGATAKEKAALASIRYQPNTAVLHRDPSQMPKRRDCWSSWAFRSQGGDIGVTYWMNRLQNIPDRDPLFVTLNPTTKIAPEAIYDTVEFAHPIFDTAALRAQKDIREMQGTNRTWFAGAWNRHGFHEDGIASAMRVVRLLGEERQTEGIEDALHGQSLEIKLSVDMRASA
jgi:predicted NAD/FAD-binding protein